ncbi:hypothetical protein ESZ50_09815 [Weissella muntiaci]|uniref:MFS transporter n=1 Tax=Weissella muntiaci TaxID=2508881 RepID=A0A6C2C1X0_9LACO|nr:hypothetical protein [Weissella muntiaci]TYC48060.1 hypothetical protein ESZ50_09815 [Weissella muntiaci]
MNKSSIYGYISIVLANLFGLTSIFIIDSTEQPWLTEIFLVLMIVFILIAATLFIVSSNTTRAD